MEEEKKNEKTNANTNQDFEVLDFDSAPSSTSNDNVSSDDIIEDVISENVKETNDGDILEETDSTTDDSVVSSPEETDSTTGDSISSTSEDTDSTTDNSIVSNPKEKVIKKEVVKEKEIVEKSDNSKQNNESKNTSNEKTDTKEENQKNDTTVSNNDNVVVKEVVVKKRSVLPTIIMIFVFILLIGAIFALPYINEYFETGKLPGSSNKNSNTNTDTPIDNTQEKEEEKTFSSGIDVKEVLSDIKNIKSYKYENLTSVYVTDEKNEKFTMENNLTYSFNDTKYKIDMNINIADFKYNVTDFYEKLDDKYYIYQNDITTNKYNKDELNQDKFNTIYNLFNNTINYLETNYEIESEKQLDNNETIDITLKTNKDILKNLSYETSRIENNIDTSKLSINEVIVDLYFDSSKELTRIEFTIEDKNIYQNEIDGTIESAVSKYTFSDFNEIKDIELPNI